MKEEKESNLLGASSKDYNAYQQHLLEQYKLFVGTALEVSERREKANIFFMATNTTLITITSFFTPYLKEQNSWGLLISFSGMLLCYYWRSIIDNYKQLNSGKFKVIHEIEKMLPLKLFDYEWDVLGKGKDKKLYKPLTHIERNIPVIFGGIYLILFIYWFYLIVY